MRILFLGDPTNPLIEWLRNEKETVSVMTEKISAAELNTMAPDIILSYGYRHIIRREIFNYPKFGSINLHISYLPWNRGADPNLWSFIENTPKGVTIHHIDEGIDTGDIIVQKEVLPHTEDTLRIFYEKLQQEIQALFKEWWPKIRTGNAQRTKQQGGGSFHLTKHKASVEPLLREQGWDTPIKNLTSTKSKNTGNILTNE